MPYERSAQRQDQANGYKPKTMLTRVGEITFEVPQVRTGGFYPSALERGSRSEQSVNLALAEIYVQGVSTRKVIEVLQKLVGPEVSISSTQISRCTEKLDVGLDAWRNRPLEETPYLLLDARYERVREGGHVVGCALWVAVGATQRAGLCVKNRSAGSRGPHDPLDLQRTGCERGQQAAGLGATELAQHASKTRCVG
jgi:transposase-like protein